MMAGEPGRRLFDIAPAALVLSGVYHLLENYYIGPRVYGQQLRLSNLAVIIAFAVAVGRKSAVWSACYWRCPQPLSIRSSSVSGCAITLRGIPSNAISGSNPAGRETSLACPAS